MEGNLEDNSVERVSHKKIYFIFGGIGIVLLLFILIFFVFRGPIEPVGEDCGDGTLEGECSLIKPYFCSSQELISNPTFCGCSDSYELIEGECVSEYGVPNQGYSFDYKYGEKNGSLRFDYYEAVLDYLLNLPRTRLYKEGETPKREDFKLDKINDPLQKEFLMPLVVDIQNSFPDSKDMQAKIAIRFVQNIPYEEPEFVRVFGSQFEVRLARYPYQVISEVAGSCEGKSELLAFILRELGFGVSLFYYAPENHEAVGIKCPVKNSYKESGYCFVETTMPSPISYAEGRYLGVGGQSSLTSDPEIILINEGLALSKNLDEYEDAKDLDSLVKEIDLDGTLNVFQKNKMDYLREKYDLLY